MSARTAIRGLARAAAWATLAAGTLGAVRQATEARDRRSGRRPPLGPAEVSDAGGPASTLPAGTSIADRLAAWIPARPRTALGRAAATAWAAPLSAVGLSVALVSGARPAWDHERGCLVATGVGGVSGTALRTVGAAANTIGAVVLVRGDAPGPALLDHESVHVRQAERLGPLLPFAYAWAGARYGYAENPLERAARVGAHRLGSLRRSRGAG